jgi:hypothetical protein
MNILCPRCDSPRIEITHHGRKAGGTVGAVAGTASGVAAATAGAEAGAALGVRRRPHRHCARRSRRRDSRWPWLAASPAALPARPSEANWTALSSTTAAASPAVTPSASSRADPPCPHEKPASRGLSRFWRTANVQTTLHQERARACTGCAATSNRRNWFVSPPTSCSTTWPAKKSWPTRPMPRASFSLLLPRKRTSTSVPCS